MKNFLLFFVAMLLFVSQPFFAGETFIYNGIKYEINGDNTTVSVAQNREIVGEIVIPSTVVYNTKNYKVTRFVVGAFMGCTDITSIEVPNSVTEIGDYAFNGCTNLFSIKIPLSVVSIGHDAFSGTGWYNNHEDGLVYVSNVMYKYKGTMPQGTSVNIKDGTVSISAGAFDNCAGLVAVEFPTSIISIGGSAFSNCYGLTSVRIPENVSSIYGWAFNNCINLALIDISSSVTFIGSSAFNNTQWYNNQSDGLIYINDIAYHYKGSMPDNTKISLKGGTKSVCGNAFSDQTGLVSIEIPNSVTSIGDMSFAGCSNLITINLPANLISIGQEAFANCNSLVSFTLPEKVSEIGDFAFWGCDGLKTISVNRNNSVYDSRNNCNAIIETAEDKLIVGCSTTIIPDNIKVLGNGAFSGCRNLYSIVLPKGVKEIGVHTFSDCINLTSIDISSEVKTIGYQAFSQCGNLRTVICRAIIPPTIYDSYSFYGVSKNIPIYVPYISIEDYQNAQVWNEFTNYECLSADPVYEEIDEPTVTPEKTSVVIAWPVDESAETYIINITKGGVTVCTITFDANGNVITIDYPSNGSTKGAELRDANALPNGYSYEITGLEEGTEYVYTVTAQNGSGVTVAEYSGTFGIQGGAVYVDEYNSGNSFSLQSAVIVNGKSISFNGVEPSDVRIYNTAGKQVSNPVPASGVYVVKVGDEAVKVMVK